MILLALVWFLMWLHYLWYKRNNAEVIEEARGKLKKALIKIEGEASSFAIESQKIRKKLYNWEKTKKKEADKK